MTCDFWNRGAHHRQHPTCAQSRLARLSPAEATAEDYWSGSASTTPGPALPCQQHQTWNGGDELGLNVPSACLPAACGHEPSLRPSSSSHKASQVLVLLHRRAGGKRKEQLRQRPGAGLVLARLRAARGHHHDRPAAATAARGRWDTRSHCTGPAWRWLSCLSKGRAGVAGVLCHLALGKPARSHAASPAAAGAPSSAAGHNPDTTAGRNLTRAKSKGNVALVRGILCG